MSPMSLLCYGWGGRRGWDVFRFPIHITRARGGQSCPPVLLSKNVLMSKNVQASREKISALQKNVTAARVRRLIAVFAASCSAWNISFNNNKTRGRALYRRLCSGLTEYDR